MSFKPIYLYCIKCLLSFLLNLGEWLALINVISPISLSLPYLTSLSLPLSFSSLQSDSCDRPASVWLMLLRCQMGERMAIMSNCAETCVCVHQRRPTSLHLITLNNSEHRYSVPVAVKETEPYPADLFSYLSLLFLSLCIVFFFFFPLRLFSPQPWTIR